MSKKKFINDNKTAKEVARKELVNNLVLVVSKTFTKLEQEVLLEVFLNNKSFREIADYKDLTSFRIKQVFEKGVRRLKFFLYNMDEKVIKYNEAIENFSEMEALLKKYKEEEELRVTKKNIIESFSLEIQNLFKTKIADTGLSARVKNTCEKGDVFGRNTVETIADLVKLNPKEMLKFRNCGKKSITEIEDFFSVNNLSWGMLS
ncbi:MAG TPA: DNA-directed RNA polymerase subunit alpha C-terminal domain-containing protein [Bacteroidia bacterium]|jgi:hypothetical protein|nr:DNA-directed RNA polymerase subunit alpha C-terminal domain-containing protein [Bacteroidia bacterium]